jgi:hypothetical protein
MKESYVKKKAGLFLVLLSLCLYVLPLYSSGLLAFGDQAAGETEKKGKVPHRIPEIDAKIRVDGVLNDEAWQKALKLEIKYEVWPGENTPAPVKTEVYLAYTRTHLYAGWKAYDPNPAAIRARYNDRDDVWKDDWVALILDPFNEHNRRFSFFVNPLGVQADTIENIANEHVPWDTLWDSAGRITDDGFVVEIAIPFSSLRFPRNKDGQKWGFDVMRSHPRNVRHFLGFFPRDRSNSCYMCQAEQMAGFEGVKPSKQIEVDPTLTGVYTQERDGFPNGEFKEKDKNVDPGVTFRWNITPNMILNSTINPDFSNVETDAAQLDINTQFALHYPEKRPFFLEGASLFNNTFNTRLTTFYSRSMAEPDWGVKMTSKAGKNAFGFYSVQDSMLNLLFPQSQTNLSTSLNMKTIGSVVRYRRDLGNASTVGLLITDREGDGYYNRLVGVDALFRFTPSDEVQVQMLGSQTQYPGEVAVNFGQPDAKFQGSAMDVYFRHNSRNMMFHAGFRQVSPDFRADLGFIAQAGYQYLEAGFKKINIRNPGSWFNRIETGPSFEYSTDYDDRLLYKALNYSFYLEGPMQTKFQLVGSFGKRSYMEQIFDTDHLMAALYMYPMKNMFLAIIANYGDHIDFTNSQPGTRFLLNPGIEYKVGRHLSATVDYLYERFNVAAGQLYTANIGYLGLAYQFNRRTFLRSILQYVDYKYNPANYLIPTDPAFKHFFSQVLFSYKINPQTMLFLGYSDNHYGYSVIPLTQYNRTIFLKIGYALRL